MTLNRTCAYVITDTEALEVVREELRWWAFRTATLGETKREIEGRVERIMQDVDVATARRAIARGARRPPLSSLQRLDINQILEDCRIQKEAKK